MITLSNGHTFTFCAAAGALGFAGEPYWWEKPWKWVNLLRPQEFTVITKTLTVSPRSGNYRWWKPWQTFRLLPHGTLNCLGLPNPGITSWYFNYAPILAKNGIKFILSIAPETIDDIKAFSIYTRAYELKFNNMVGIQLNLSCPNTQKTKLDLGEVIDAARAYIGLPVILKLGYYDDYISIAKKHGRLIDGIELINTIPWSKLFRTTPSPLKKYGYEGGVSGTYIAKYSSYALQQIKEHEITVPIISGGGVYSYEEAVYRLKLGAAAVSIGTLFLRRPWEPNQIIDRFYREYPDGVTEEFKFE
jgi:dihydroorotate dehydrogenase (NAD+) catalytic subunit